MLGTLIVAASTLPCAAHHAALAEPDWCPQSPPPAGTIGTPGKFPGPARHDKMTNMELGSFDLAKEIPALAGRTVRARFWLMEPGGVIAEHCHNDRPALVYLLKGEVLETIELDGNPVVRTLKQGSSIPEGNGTRHWWKNVTTENVLMVAIDIPNSNRPAPRRPLPETKNVEVRDLDRLLLKKEYPHVPDVANYKMQGRLLTFREDGLIGLEYHAGRPGIAYVVEGTLLEHRSDQEGPLVRREGDLSMISGNLWNYWENKSLGKATLLVVEFLDCGKCEQ
jgi:quercetin dioxygenase-like cupin family protein